MSDNDSLSPFEQDAILRDVGASLLEAAPSEWTELRFTLGATAEISLPHFEAVQGDGSIVSIKPPRVARKRLRELRSGMYEPGKGTWFTARYVITRPARYSVDFDYDNEPEFDFPLVPLTYVNDLKYFPRDEAHIPDWLRRKLEEAEAEGSGS